MVTFWLSSAVLVGLVLIFLWWPYFSGRRHSSTDEIDRNALNVEIFRSRLAELQKELDDDNLDQASFDELKQELESNLLEEVDDSQIRIEHNRLGAVTPLILSIAIPLVAAVLYMQWGAVTELDKEPRALAEEGDGQMQQIEQQVEQLKSRLEASPDNAEGWFMLGRTYLTLGRFQEGYDAFGRLIELVGEHAEILGQQAYALYLLNNNQITPEVQAAIDRTLAKDPEEAGTLGLLGMNAFEAGDYQKALGYWQKVLRSNNPNINREGLQSAVQAAKDKLAEQGISYQDPEPVVDETAPTAELKVWVELADDLRSRVEDDTVVFVLAQPVQGPRMPLAAVKLRAGELPTTVTLNDSMAMGPMVRLSSAEQVRVRALISYAGNAAAAPGDLYGSSEPVAVQGNNEVVKLNIDSVVE